MERNGVEDIWVRASEHDLLKFQARLLFDPESNKKNAERNKPAQLCRHCEFLSFLVGMFSWVSGEDIPKRKSRK